MGLLKIWELSKRLRALKMLLLTAVGLALLLALIMWHGEPLSSPQGFIAALALLGLTVALGRFGLSWVLQLFDIRKTAHQFLTGLALSVVGWLGTWNHVWVFDRIYLRKGKLKQRSR